MDFSNCNGKGEFNQPLPLNVRAGQCETLFTKHPHDFPLSRIIIIELDDLSDLDYKTVTAVNPEIKQTHWNKINTFKTKYTSEISSCDRFDASSDSMRTKRCRDPKTLTVKYLIN